MNLSSCLEKRNGDEKRHHIALTQAGTEASGHMVRGVFRSVVLSVEVLTPKDHRKTQIFILWLTTVANL